MRRCECGAYLSRPIARSVLVGKVNVRAFATIKREKVKRPRKKEAKGKTVK